MVTLVFSMLRRMFLVICKKIEVRNFLKELLKPPASIFEFE